jgi:hypothetical protein
MESSAARPTLIFLALIVAFVMFGVLGKVTTAGYHCHWITVGQSRVCQ